jgi:DNA polymerase (family 10)
VTRSALLDYLRQFADFADIRGTSLDAAAWRQLSSELERGGDAELERVVALSRSDRLDELTTLPSNLRWKLHGVVLDDPEVVRAAEMLLLPWLPRTLLQTGISSSTAAAALARAGIVTLDDLAIGLLDGRVAAQARTSEGDLRSAVAALSDEHPIVPLGRAVDLLDHFTRLIIAECPGVESLVVAGDVRRGEPLARTLSIVDAAADPSQVLDAIGSLPGIEHTLHRTNRRAIVSHQRLEIDVRIVAPDEYGTALFVATGSRAHLAAMRTRQPAVRLCRREEEVYAHAGLAWIPAEMRHDTGEIEAAATGVLPAVVAREHLRGDLHMHTTYSDGGDGLLEMIQTCAALGYEYIAITDHSERAAASHTVSQDALARQRDEIARHRERFPDLVILHGIEVDILPDGSLDFPDDILETLDIVLASLHDNAGHDAARLTARCLAAIAHPLVNVITHPANRLVGRTPGYELDFPSIYAAAAAHGTALEIDGAPSHLDLDGEHARAAVAAGATVTIDSDCHRARLLDKQLRLGVATARRGWVEPRHVLNTRPIAEVRAFVAAKRRLGR